MELIQLHTPEQAVQWLRERVRGTLHSDNRKITHGDAFIAVPGAMQDGRDFVISALSQGASACLVEAQDVQMWPFAQNPATSHALACYVGLKTAIGAIASLWFGNPSASLSVVAVTGTNGKTSTTWWLAQLLNALPVTQKIPCAIMGTLGVGVPERLVYTGLTTPDALTTQAFLHALHKDGAQACAMEASSIGLEQGRLNATAVRVAVFTNLSQDHLDFHGSMQAYWQAKKALFQWPGLRAVVINLDDPRGSELAQTVACGEKPLDVWTVSRQTTASGGARLCAQNIRYGAQGMCFDVREGVDTHGVQTPFIGDYNVTNILCVLAAARALGVPLESAVGAVQQCSAVPGRMESSGGIHGAPLVVVDFAHTPDALENVLKTLQAQARARAGRLWCVFGCGGERDVGKRPLMGAIAEQYADRVVVSSDNPRSEQPERIIAQILSGIQNQEKVAVNVDRAQAIAQAVMGANAQDVILVAGKGHEDYQEIAGKRLPFSDKQQVQEALQRYAAERPHGGVA